MILTITGISKLQIDTRSMSAKDTIKQDIKDTKKDVLKVVKH